MNQPNARAHVQPVGVPVTLEWRNLDLYVKTKTGHQQILFGMSGAARPGELIALMGPSGAGKTSFMNMLAGRNRCHYRQPHYPQNRV
jgi:ABC-type lipoprotein export system ATPase subunit